MPPSDSGRLTLVGAPALVRSLVVLLTEVPVLHAHQGEGAGLYDDECAALRLATSPNRYGPSPRPLVGIRGLSPAGELPAIVLPSIPGTPLGPTGSRAPPRFA